MYKRQANHGAISYGHIGQDLITLASMLRIPVCIHTEGIPWCRAENLVVFYIMPVSYTHLHMVCRSDSRWRNSWFFSSTFISKVLFVLSPFWYWLMKALTLSLIHIWRQVKPVVSVHWPHSYKEWNGHGQVHGLFHLFVDSARGHFHPRRKMCIRDRYNTKEEIDMLAAGIERVSRMFWFLQTK